MQLLLFQANTQCTSCLHYQHEDSCVAECPTFTIPDGKICKFECEERFYKIHENKTCAPCHTECESNCDGPVSINITVWIRESIIKC